MDKYSIDDLISAAVDQSPSKFGEVFSSLMADRLSDAVERKKVDIAANLYNSQPYIETETAQEEE